MSADADDEGAEPRPPRPASPLQGRFRGSRLTEALEEERRADRLREERLFLPASDEAEST